jgi:hypothetical protein
MVAGPRPLVLDFVKIFMWLMMSKRRGVDVRQNELMCGRFLAPSDSIKKLTKFCTIQGDTPTWVTS